MTKGWTNATRIGSARWCGRRKKLALSRSTNRHSKCGAVPLSPKLARLRCRRSLRGGGGSNIIEVARVHARSGQTKSTTPNASLCALFFIAFASFAASCSAEREQIESKTQGMDRELTAAYYACVRTAFVSQRRTMVDRNAAIDQVFMVCKPEEAKLQAFEESRSENPNVSKATIAAHRNRLKEELLRER